MKFAQWKVSTRLAAGFGVVVALGALVASIAFVRLNDVSNDLNTLVTDRMVKIAKLNEVKDWQNLTARAARNIVITHDPAAKAAEMKSIDAAREKNNALLDELDKMITLPRGRELFAKIQAARPLFRAELDKALALAMAGQDAEAGALLLGPVRDAQQVYFKAVDE